MADTQQSSPSEMPELAARARAISQDASTRVTGAMREMINAAAGIAGFAVESARDLVQYMVRRGQMTAAEGEKLVREVEAVHNRKPKAERDRIAAAKAAAEQAAAKKKAAIAAANHDLHIYHPPAPGRLTAAGAGKTVKAAKPAEPSVEVAKVAEPAKKPSKADAKTAAPSKAAAKAAPAAKPAAAAKAAPAKAKATPVKAKTAKPAAKAPAKPAKKAAGGKKRS
jgi:polyhydroxyalkanoate synthesis regulator phasin